MLGVERYSVSASDHLVATSTLEGRTPRYWCAVLQSWIPIAVAARTTVWRDGEPLAADRRFVDEPRRTGHALCRATGGRRIGQQNWSPSPAATTPSPNRATPRRDSSTASTVTPTCARATSANGRTCGAVRHRFRFRSGRHAGKRPAPAAPAGDGSQPRRRPRRRGARPRTQRRGLPRPHLLGRTVRLPGAQPALPRGHPFAAALPLPTTPRSPPGRPRGRATPVRCSPGNPAATAGRRARSCT